MQAIASFRWAVSNAGGGKREQVMLTPKGLLPARPARRNRCPVGYFCIRPRVISADAGEMTVASGFLGGLVLLENPDAHVEAGRPRRRRGRLRRAAVSLSCIASMNRRNGSSWIGQNFAR